MFTLFHPFSTDFFSFVKTEKFVRIILLFQRPPPALVVIISYTDSLCAQTISDLNAYICVYASCCTRESSVHIIIIIIVICMRTTNLVALTKERIYTYIIIMYT